MRLTNVAHLRLPFGRLVGYNVTVTPTDRMLPISFDQHRHVSVGDRAGSWMAVSLRLPKPVPRAALAAAWLAVVRRHGTLRSVFERGDDGGLVLREVEIGEGEWAPHEIAPGQTVSDALREVIDATCTPFSRPSHRLCVLETADGPTIVIAADHSHVDMWSMLVLGRDLLAALAAAGEGRHPELDPAPAFAEHTRALEDRPTAPEDVRRRWAEVLAASGDAMPRFPLSLGEPSPQRERVEVRDVLGVDDVAAFSAQARDYGVSTLALVVSAMTHVTHELAGSPLRAVFPVHSRYDATWLDSVGWFITNSVIESVDPDPVACAAAVKEAVQLGAWPLADVLQPWGGMPEAPRMFAISWLDLRRLPVRIDSLGLEAQYVGATILTDGVMLWFILDAQGLHLRCRYPDTAQGREHVGAWLDALVTHLRSEARASVGGLLTLGNRHFRVQRAARGDVPAIVGLLADDELGRDREVAELAHYEAAFDAIAHDSSHYLVAVRDEGDRIVGTMQLTVIPGLSRAGATRLQIEGVRVAAHERSRGLGTAMLEWAHGHGRARGATVAQLTTDLSRSRAHDFFRALGYASTQAGLTRDL
ncbi:peptide synthetase [Pseudoclavibacter endophyticus]|uniref:GNAT family N-acetyltransferase n=1 Tax=Pseudoclavibacter endophyticus TaxID=1778590 RepID=A0A6H9WIR1_9MICO|nr:GNAT family N-acetyltransferase [Pseudoclavibacter endophyticus]KAB1646693.1 GNAT family N-acetyltransferase [Pseudoclavibacter endophyticus]GGA76385.1 peptide synthetase [Pseudoclavibacter endophyticus]